MQISLTLAEFGRYSKLQAALRTASDACGVPIAADFSDVDTWPERAASRVAELEAAAKAVVFEGLYYRDDALIPSESLRLALVALRKKFGDLR